MMNRAIDHEDLKSRYPRIMNTLSSHGIVSVMLATPLMLFMMTPEATGQDLSGRTPPLVIESGKTPLLPREGLDGWTLVSGDATIEHENGVLRGHEAGDRNAFLMSDRTWGDFILEGEVRIEPGGNSGWQIRSGIDDPKNTGSRLRGYQIEVETTDRRWSGGIYEEGLRGWLDPLSNDEEARAAFKIGEWNRYRIEAQGIHLRSWVNGVPCGDLLDLARLEGHLAFQVHTGSCDVRWRNLEITDLGRSRFISKGDWQVIEDSDGEGGIMTFIPPEETRTVRFEHRLEGAVNLKIMNQDLEPVMELALREDEPFISGAGKPSRFPEVAPGAGMKIRRDGKNEVVIDLHQGRLTVVRDGVVLAKRYDLNCSSIRGLQLCTSGAGKESIETGGIQCLVNEKKPREKQ